MSILKKAYAKSARIISDMHRDNAYKAKNAAAHDRLKANPRPELTAEQKKEIDAYWAAYGIKFSDYSWFQLYYGMTGIADPRYIPQEFYFYMVLPYYNSRRLIQAYKDKNAFDTYIPKKYFPKTILKRISGDFYDKDGVFVTGDVNDPKLREILSAHQSVIVENALDSGRGENVKKHTFRTEEDIAAMLKTWNVRDYIVQEVLEQHPFMAQFNESSVNIIRINSWYHDGKVEISTPVIRFGLPGYATDCCFIDGEEVVHLVGVTEDGLIRDKVIDLTGKVENLSDYVSVNDRRVPAWDKITDMIRESAARLKHYHLIGWDITVSADEEPVIIEYNILYPSPYSSQATDGPMWGEHTDQLLAFLKDKRNQDKYIPAKYRL